MIENWYKIKDPGAERAWVLMCSKFKSSNSLIYQILKVLSQITQLQDKLQIALWFDANQSLGTSWSKPRNQGTMENNIGKTCFPFRSLIIDDFITIELIPLEWELKFSNHEVYGPKYFYWGLYSPMPRLETESLSYASWLVYSISWNNWNIFWQWRNILLAGGIDQSKDYPLYLPILKGW